MKKYVIVSGLNLNDNNRGTAALSYGAISFLYNKKLLNQEQKILRIKFTRKFWEKKCRRDEIQVVNVDGIQWQIVVKHVFVIEKILLLRLGLLLPFTSFARSMRNVERVAAINGGDGFSDIYNTKIFLNRLPETLMAMKLKIPLIQLPQTLGPFYKRQNYKIAEKILKYSDKVFIRDNKFVEDLIKMEVQYELTYDLSFYMNPQAWNIKIEENAIGINVSGLAYSNKFRSLTGKFDQYPNLINHIIYYFRNKGHVVYLIPHSYNYNKPEDNNDDLLACREVYDNLKNKEKIILLDRNLTSPQVKYVISKMKFFIGTRMHANFAAIYTGVPLFGLAYSYKFEGAFNANGLNGSEQTALINDITKDDIPRIIAKMESFYVKVFK